MVYSNEYTIKKEAAFLFIVVNKKIIDDNYFRHLSMLFGSKEKIGIDMRNVDAISSSEFIKYLISNKIKLYNLKNDVLLYLSIVLKDNNLRSYMRDKDFKMDKYELIKRKFKIA